MATAHINAKLNEYKTSVIQSYNTVVLSYSIIVRMVVLYTYRDHEGLGILAQNYHPKTSLIFAFWQFGSIG